MKAKEPRRLELEVRFDAEPIQGRLFDPNDHAGLDRPFSGWLGLISAIEAVRGIGPSPPRERKGDTR
jgi:hypothetical protein